MTERDYPVHASDPPVNAFAVAAVCGSEILGLAGYSLVPALLPQFMEAWSLTNTEAGWLAGMVFAGYMIGVLPLVGLTDRWPARSIYLASSLLNALACFGIALSENLLPALVFRAVAGVALAGMYMPGLRALTDGLEGERRARIAGFYTSSFTIGTALSFLRGQLATEMGWRGAFIAAGLLGLAAALLAWAWLPRSPAHPGEKPQPVFAWRAVIRDRDVLMLIFGYTAVIWGSTGLRQWIVVFLAVCAAWPGTTTEVGWSMLATAAVINLLGVPAGLLGNELSIRFGLRKTASLVFLMSAIATGLFGLTATLPYAVVIGLALAAGFIVQGNFSHITAGLTAWVVSFGSCGLVCLAGAGGIMFLSRDIDRIPPEIERVKNH